MEKYVKRGDDPILICYPDVLYFVNTKQDGDKVVYVCLQENKQIKEIDSEFFSKYYVVATPQDCFQKNVLDKRLKAVFTIMEQENMCWKDVKETISILKKEYPCMEAYIEIKYCNKQEELKKYEPIQ